jgi:hypothetical protein
MNKFIPSIALLLGGLCGTAFGLFVSNSFPVKPVSESKVIVPVRDDHLQTITPKEVCIDDWIYYQFPTGTFYTYAPKIDYSTGRFRRCP